MSVDDLPQAFYCGGMSDEAGVLQGIRVVEIADETAAHAGLELAGLGADVIKVERPGGSPARRIGPFLDGRPDSEQSIFFWQHNRGKRSVVVNPDDPTGADVVLLRALIASSDVLLLSGADAVLLDEVPGLDQDSLLRDHPGLVLARMTPFGEDGPWASWKANDLVHLALGGPVMNCGYDPLPDGTYELPPIAPAAWQSYVIAGEQLVIGVLAALHHARRTGEGQYLSCAVHEAVAKSTELDLMNWVMRRSPLRRQTCRHAAETVSQVPTVAQTKDGRYLLTMPMGAKNEGQIADFLTTQGMPGPWDTAEVSESGGRDIPGSGAVGDRTSRLLELVQRWVRKLSYDTLPWLEAQQAGVVCAPVRRPHENVTDEHWQARRTFAEVDHPELGRSLTYAVRKWISTEPDWVVGRRAPLLGEDTESVRAELTAPARVSVRTPGVVPSARQVLSGHGMPMPLAGVRIFDFGWFLASAGGTRSLAALGAEVIKVEWKANPDTRMAAMAPVGGRVAREQAIAPLPGVTDPDMGGQFNNKNPGKLGLSLNVRHPEGLAIARALIAKSDVVAEGFSPGVLDRWGLGWDQLQEIKPDIIYAQ
jgi:crotonobetainyl-CoA:carnitine CoA-transferase CaiB-like acyl-CoA transferase